MDDELCAMVEGIKEKRLYSKPISELVSIALFDIKFLYMCSCIYIFSSKHLKFERLCRFYYCFWGERDDKNNIRKGVRTWKKKDKD